MPSLETVHNLLGRLSQRTQSFGGIGGIPKYTWETIAASMRGIPRGPTSLVRAVYSLDGTDGKSAIIELMLAMEKDQAIQSWKCSKLELTKLCALVVAVRVRPLLCRRCKGRGHIYPRGAPARVCDACEGAHRRDIAPREIAKAVGVPSIECGKNGKWRKRYLVVTALAEEWIEMAAGRMRKALDERGMVAI